MTHSERMALTKRKLTEALDLMEWKGGVHLPDIPRPSVAVKYLRTANTVANIVAYVVEPVFHDGPPKIARHDGKGITRWEIWVRPDWIERVLERGLACFPEANLLVLDAEPIADVPEGCEECYHLAAATRMVCGSTAHVSVTAAYYAVVLGGVAGVAQGSKELAASQAMLKWQKAIGLEPNSNFASIRHEQKR